MTEQEFAALMATYRQHYRGITKDIELQIFALIEQGVDPQEAVKTVLARYPPGNAIKEPLLGLMVTAAINGAGGREAFTASMIDAMKNTLVNLPWAADNMPLSNRLHKLNGAMRQALDDEIHTAIRKGTNWQTLSRQVYDGYGHGGRIKRADDLPKYLKELQQVARSIIGDDPAAMQAYRKLLRQINRLQTPGLRAAYTKLIEAAKKGTDKAVEKAIKTALEERSRYYAERIARTELARAWADGFYARTLDDPDIVAYRWKLSSNHPVKDICDFHALADLYGLGPGVYPKNKMPPMPAHPHCRCHLVEVFVGELDDKVQDDRLHERGQKFLASLTPAEQTALLGVEGAKKWRDGDKWEDHLVGWAGHEKPASRLKKLFQSGETNGIMGTEGVIPLEQAKKRDHKITITDVAIDKVPLVKVPGFTAEQNLALQEAHKEILRSAKVQNDSNEVLGVYLNDFSRRVYVMGDEFGVYPASNPEVVLLFRGAGRQEIMYLHNHPSTNRFSMADIDTFVSEGKIGTMSVVTNQGEVYVLHKGNTYEYNKAIAVLRILYETYNGDVQLVAEEFPKYSKRAGVYYEKSK